MSGRALVELVGDLSWQRDALCVEYPWLNWFPVRGESLDEVRRVCSRCLVKVECREYAIEFSVRHGIWGGMSALERARGRARRVTMTFG